MNHQKHFTTQRPIVRFFLNRIAIKSEDKRKFTKIVGKLPENEATFIKFYQMKKDLIPKSHSVYFVNQKVDLKWKPSARECSVMTHISSVKEKHKFLVYAGLSNEALNEIIEISFDDQTGITKYKKIKEDVIIKQKDNKFGRYGHTEVSFDLTSPITGEIEKVIVYYGGGEMFNKVTKLRE